MSNKDTLTTLVNDSLNLDFHYNMKILLIIDARENRRGIQDIWNKSNKIEEEFNIYETNLIK
jgi:hypothetical protein